MQCLLTAGGAVGAQSDRAQAVTFYHRVLDEAAGPGRNREEREEEQTGGTHGRTINHQEVVSQP